MSMSQEEIEALMSGADDIHIDDTEDSSSEEEIIEDVPKEESTEIDNEIVQEQESDTSDSEEVVEKVATDDEETDDVNVDELLAGIDGIVYDEDEEKNDKDDEENSEEVNIDDILANIEGIKDDSDIKTESTHADKKNDPDDLEAKINSSQYPMPVNDENKVVNQLNEVADDSEEKASQIFDVLSFILDENSEIATYNKQMAEFIEKQKELLESLSVKFPNVNVFQENLDEAKNLMEVSQSLSSKVDAENNKVFEAMELMQYHDINRQKIERVMAVIKKLSSYLNGLFEDDSGKAEVQIAKHISGDSNEVVDSDDIDALISEFSNE